MAGKPNFTKMNPNAKLAGDYKESEPLETNTQTTTEPIKPIHVDLQQNKNTNKKGQKYLRLDISGYQDYISLMAEHLTNTSGKYVSMTQYILRLIESDKQQNIEIFQKLEQIENMKRELI